MKKKDDFLSKVNVESAVIRGISGTVLAGKERKESINEIMEKITPETLEMMRKILKNEEAQNEGKL